MQEIRNTFGDLMSAIAHTFVPYAYEEKHITTIYRELAKRELQELNDAINELLGEEE